MERKDISLQIWNLLRDASVNTEFIMTEFSTRNKLTRLQGRALLQIFIQDEVRLSDLADIMGMNPGNLSRVCQSLEDEGYIQRQRSLEDRRAWAISLTDKGMSIIQRIVEGIETTFKSFLNEHTHEELELLIKLWTDYNHYFNQAKLDYIKKHR